MSVGNVCWVKLVHGINKSMDDFEEHGELGLGMPCF